MIIKSKTKTGVYSKAAILISSSIKELLKKQKYVILGVPGGRSISHIFKLLKKEKLPWNKVHFFLVDERCVPLTSKDSNFKRLRENLLISIKPPEGNIHPFNHKTGALIYSNELKKFGKFDIVLLSAGEDGHVASLFPHYTIENKSKDFIFVSNSPKPPQKRISASRRLLESSKISILLFIGKEKETAFKNFLDNNIPVEGCPAKLVNKTKESYVITNLTFQH
jgi:6-phosphogluconolactonase